MTAIVRVRNPDTGKLKFDPNWPTQVLTRKGTYTAPFNFTGRYPVIAIQPAQATARKWITAIEIRNNNDGTFTCAMYNRTLGGGAPVAKYWIFDDADLATAGLPNEPHMTLRNQANNAVIWDSRQKVMRVVGHLSCPVTEASVRMNIPAGKDYAAVYVNRNGMFYETDLDPDPNDPDWDTYDCWLSVIAYNGSQIWIDQDTFSFDGSTSGTESLYPGFVGGPWPPAQAMIIDVSNY